LIPIMPAAMTDEDTAARFDFFDQLTPLHASSSSA
jgi:hypothetical protein